MSAKVKITHGSGNVFKDLGFPEAENLKLRSELMIKIENFVEKNGLTQQEAARVLGITQPWLKLLLKDKIEKFSLDALVNMLARAGLRVELRVKKAA
ncbi:MAG TPA: helix-turn-helix transcriptional regulator [Acidiferrobacterales bacterium]|nr:helix-turn-helix transcriptional regulator [Acidiferrobacterales bacterium]